MARLKKAAKAARHAANHAASSQTSTNPKASIQQPHDGSTSDPLSSAAALGASLLNNARIRQSHTSPTGVTAKKDNGKLKHPTSAAKAVQEELAIRGNIFELQASPDKRGPNIQDQDDQASPKVSRKENSPPADGQRSPAAEALPSSPPAIATSSDYVTRQRSCQEEQQPTRKAGVTKDSVAAAEPAPKTKVHNTRTVRAVNTAPVRRSEPQVRIPARKRRRTPDTIVVDVGEVAPNPPAETEEDSHDGVGKRSRSKRQHGSRKEQTSSRSLKASSPVPANDDASESSPSTGKVKALPLDATITTVLNFLDQERRPGRGKTHHVATLKRICKVSRSALSHDDSTLDTVKETTDAIGEVISQALRELHDDDRDDRREFKYDAFAFLFRIMVSHLKAIHEWLGAREVVATDSLDVMRIVTPFMRDILLLKDTVAQWGVSVPQRFKGDRVIKDVESYLIVPLRKAHKTYDSRLRQLEAAEKRRQEHRKLHQQLREEAEEREREAETVARRQQRQRRWQDLHIARMQCEPDPFKRRKLIITPLEDLEETDANGVRFERVPVFKERPLPAIYRAAAHPDERTWTNDEEIALLEAVQRYAGPKLYEEIFRTQCGPGGILRDFTVADIVAKVSWIRSSWLKLQQEKGWEAPEWAQALPTSP
ncbi:hypothetical protein J1614_003616 [Plenodomus biglobosus]|nr:hypothetical protein J1614_003616 [Plenodomus biglobosus]